jgi:hypothetical protein
VKPAGFAKTGSGRKKETTDRFVFKNTLRRDVKRSLAFSGHSVQINAPLLPNDKFLQLVPASHMRPSTTVELAASRYADELGARKHAVFSAILFLKLKNRRFAKTGSGQT